MKRQNLSRKKTEKRQKKSVSKSTRRKKVRKMPLSHQKQRYPNQNDFILLFNPYYDYF